MADTESIPFGPATVTVGEGVDAITFDGQSYMQAEGGQLQLTPQWSDITTICRNLILCKNMDWG
jgi:hypothetical protein